MNIHTTELEFSDYSTLGGCFPDGYAPGWLERFHRGTYRAIIMEALFSPAILDPLMGREEDISSFPPYTPDPTLAQQLDVLFGGFIDWLAADRRERGRVGNFCKMRFGTQLLSGEDQGAVMEVMVLLTMAELGAMAINHVWGRQQDEQSLGTSCRKITLHDFFYGEFVISFPWSGPVIITDDPSSPSITIRKRCYCHHPDRLELNEDEYEYRDELMFFDVALKRWGLCLTDQYFCTHIDDYDRQTWFKEGGYMSIRGCSEERLQEIAPGLEARSMPMLELIP